MPRATTGQVIERRGKRGKTYALRFRAYGKRHYLTLGSAEEGWARRRAEEELDRVLAEVKLGLWQPPNPDPVDETETEIPTFHVFASEFVARRSPEWQPRTEEYWRWALELHLLVFFRDHRLDEITPTEVERFKAMKLREREEQLVERPLGNRSINKLLSMLGTVLDDAIELGLIAGANPARGKRRQLRARKPRRSWLSLDQAKALLDNAGEHRPFVAAGILGGLRVGELLSLRWADVALGSGALTVRESKTDAGRRTVDLSPTLTEILAEWKATTRYAGSDELVFPTSRGTPQDRRNAAKRWLAPAVDAANAKLAEAELPAIEGCSMHTLRRTFISLQLEAGAPVPYVMRQVGHTQPQVTLGIYAAVLERSRDTGERLDALLNGAPMGTSAQTTTEAGGLVSVSSSQKGAD